MRKVRATCTPSGDDSDKDVAVLLGTNGPDNRVHKVSIEPKNYTAPHTGLAVDFNAIETEADHRGVFKLAVKEGKSWSLASGDQKPLNWASVTAIKFSHGAISPKSMRAAVLLA